jgi:hypothetical protein
MEGALGVEVRVAVEAGHAETLLRDLAVLGLIELFVREGRQQKAQAFHLDRGNQPDH